jgi:hypothetical protein
MGQIHSLNEVEHATITPADGVPMLDWPSDLFSDNASAADLVTVDYLLPSDPEFLPFSRESQELCIQLAA